MDSDLTASIGPDTAQRTPLEPVKGVPERLKSALDPDRALDQGQDPAEAKKGAFEYTAEVIGRLKQSRDEMDRLVAENNLDEETGQKIDPTRSPAFLKFLRETLAEVHGRYIVAGKFTRPGLPNDDAPGTPLDGTATGAPEQNVSIPAGLDPALANSPAARLALSLGADLMSDEED